MMMNRVSIPLEDRTKLSGALQGLLNPLQELVLQTKQAHWAVVGEEFQSFHLNMDELNAAYGLFVDSVAERMLALGFVPAGQVGDIAAKPVLSALPEGFVQKGPLMSAVADSIGAVAARVRAALAAVGGLDVVTDDLLTEMLQSMEKTLWMLAAQEVHA
ncbi:MAG: DNA starvation/stationary phase protection protein [Candidatus Hydrogenedentes bacterium]|nr:DNA starvation/stationary phase protection protein [Candidatus Hydrogenedentota bacterium]